MSGGPRAMVHEVTRLVVERLNAGAAALYEPQAVWPTQPIGDDRACGDPGGVPADGRRRGEVDMETPLPTVGSRTWRRPRPAQPTTPASMCRCCAASQVTIYGWSTKMVSPASVEAVG
jgi:hypothetical protein